MKLYKLLFRKQQHFNLLLLCFSIVFALLICEAILHFVLPSGYYIWPPHLKKIFKPYPDVMPGVSGDSMFVINSRGIRGDELTSSHTYRILAIGGSTTICLYLDQSETWPYLLQKTLNDNIPNQNVWVGNAGLDGRTTRHHLMVMQYLPLREMKIDTIIFLIGVNDFTKRLAKGDDYDPNFLSKPEAEEKLLDQTFIGGRHSYPADPFYKRTSIWRMLRRIKIIYSQNNTKYNVQDEVGKTYVNWRKHRQQAEVVRNELPDLSSALEEYARNINKLIDIAQEKSVRMIFMTQPTMWESDLPEELDALLWFGRVVDIQEEGSKAYYSTEALEEGMEKYNDTLLKICSERQVECIDFSSLLNKDTTVFYDDVHFNEKGAQKVAEILANHTL